MAYKFTSILCIFSILSCTPIYYHINKSYKQNITSAIWSPNSEKVAFTYTNLSKPLDEGSNYSQSDIYNSFIYTVQTDGSGLKQVSKSNNVLLKAHSWNKNKILISSMSANNEINPSYVGELNLDNGEISKVVENKSFFITHACYGYNSDYIVYKDNQLNIYKLTNHVSYPINFDLNEKVLHELSCSPTSNQIYISYVQPKANEYQIQYKYASVLDLSIETGSVIKTNAIRKLEFNEISGEFKLLNWNYDNKINYFYKGDFFEYDPSKDRENTMNITPTLSYNSITSFSPDNNYILMNDGLATLRNFNRVTSITKTLTNPDNFDKGESVTGID